MAVPRLLPEERRRRVVRLHCLEPVVAADREQLIIAETAVKNVEDQLRALIFDTSDRQVWDVAVGPVDSPPVGSRHRI